MEPEPINIDEFLHLLRALVREPSVVGVEDAFFRVLRRELEESPVKVERYHGLLVARGADPDSIYLSAHVDRHGLLCTGPNEFQYAAFIAGNRGELTGDSISEQFMELIAGRFEGQRVQAHAPYAGSYMGQGQITRSYVCPRRRNLIFEIEGLLAIRGRMVPTQRYPNRPLDRARYQPLCDHGRGGQARRCTAEPRFDG